MTEKDERAIIHWAKREKSAGNMRNLKGKKLLILGASSNETTLVERAQSMGIYVIVTDLHENWDIAPAKKIADEAPDFTTLAR